MYFTRYIAKHDNKLVTTLHSLMNDIVQEKFAMYLARYIASATEWGLH